MHLEPGTRLGPYEIQSGIGAGGMGEVYRARDHRLERDVAIKVLPSQFAPGSRQLKQFEFEARLLASLNHPSICAIYDIGADRGVTFIVMEHLRGETLADRIGRGPVPVNVALYYAIQIAEALHAAHSANVVHRDIKPGNIMLTTSGIKLLDFGLAKRHMAAAVAIPGIQKDTQVDTGVQDGIVGTLHYMAPEQLSGGVVDARSDIWAFGCVIYEMVAGRRAFSGTLTEVVAAIVRDRPPAWTIEHGVAPIALEHVVSKCLSRDPVERWQTVAELSKELHALVPHAKEDASRAAAAEAAMSKPPSSANAPRGSGGSSPAAARAETSRRQSEREQEGRPIQGTAQAAPAPRRKTWLWAAIAVVTLVAVGAVAWTFRAAVLPSSGPVVAVLPFTTSGAADQEVWGHGLAEGVAADLAHSDRIRMVPASVAFGVDTHDAQSAATGLGANRVVTGHAELQAGRLVVEASLVELPDGRQIWSGRLSQPIAQGAELQRELTGSIAKALGIEASGDSRLTMLPSQVNADAYSLLLQGWFAAHRSDERSLRSAIGFFNQASAQDARLAAAFAGSAAAQARLVQAPLFAARPADALAAARASAAKALELDPSLAGAQVAAAYATAIADRDWKGAGDALEQAARSHPLDPLPHDYYSAWLMAVRRTDEAVQEARTAVRLAPASGDAPLMLGWQLFLARQYDAAVEQLKKVPKGALPAGGADWALGVAYGEAGRRDESLAALKAATSAAPAQPVYLATLAYAQAKAGHGAEAQSILQRLRDPAARAYVPSYDVGLAYLALDDYAHAFELLQRAVEERAAALAFLQADPRLDPIRSDQRFNDLLKGAGF
jgi:serine/threonine protein kinase/TolB-like protein/Tfp pilus assembly protein PilF